MSALIGSIVAFIVAGLAILGLVPHQQIQPVPQLPQQAIQQPTNTLASNSSPTLMVIPAPGVAPLATTFNLRYGQPGVEYTVDFGDPQCDPSNACAGNLTVDSPQQTKIYKFPGIYTVRLWNTYDNSPNRSILFVTKIIVSSSPISVPGMSKYTDPDFGFSFWYPSGWVATSSKSFLFVKVVNPARAGKPDSDVPSEYFLIRRQGNSPCKGTTVSFAGKNALDTGWQDSNFAGGLFVRSVCFQLNGLPIRVDSSAFDRSSKAIMDAMFASFTLKETQ